MLARCTLVKQCTRSRLLTPTLTRTSKPQPLPLAPHRFPSFCLSTRLFSSSHHLQNLQTPTMPTANLASYPSPPVFPPNWKSYTAASIPLAVDEAIKQGNTLLDSIAALPKTERTFESVIRPYALKTAEFDREVEPSLFLQYVSTDEAVREASVAGDKKVQDWGLEALTRLDVFEAMVDAKEHTEKEGIKLEAEEQRLLDRLLMDRTRNGLALPEKERAKYLEVRSLRFLHLPRRDLPY